VTKLLTSHNSRHSELQTLGTSYENTILRFTKRVYTSQAQQGDASNDSHDSNHADVGIGFRRDLRPEKC